MKRELYEQAKDSVLKHTEVSEVLLLSSNREDCVDARCLLVCVLSRHGLTDTEIAEMMGVTRPCVNKLRASFIYRNSKRMFNILWKRISNEVVMNE